MGRGAWTGIALSIALAAALSGAAQAGAAKAGDDESQRFAAFLDSVYQETLAHSPQIATEAGSRLGDDRWDDTSEPALAADAARIRGYVAKAKSGFDYAKLDPA